MVRELLLEDEGFKKQYDELVNEGWVLKDILVENCENDANISGIQPYGSDKTYYTRRGKVITSSFAQKEKTTKKYNNKIYDTYQKVQNRISFAISAVSQGKISWIASTLFSIDVTNYAPFVNTGYQKVTENATLHMKDAYYKEGKKYWLGYSVKKLNVAGTVSTYFKDKKENPHQKSKSYSKTFTTQNYNKSNDDLVRLARKYYNTGWVNEKITASQTIRVN